jgi:hypothetical protein
MPTLQKNILSPSSGLDDNSFGKKKETNKNENI